eukprot:750730-Hanusia_phi.AAC.1
MASKSGSSKQPPPPPSSSFPAAIASCGILQQGKANGGAENKAQRDRQTVTATVTESERGEGKQAACCLPRGECRGCRRCGRGG